MIGWSEKHGDVTTFRIDRIKNIPEVLEEKATSMPKGFKLNEHINTMFHMFSTKREEVILECDNDTLDSVLDKFGTKTKVVPKGEDTSVIEATVAVNHVFYSWIFGFGGKVKIAAPEQVIEGYREMIISAANMLQ